MAVGHSFQYFTGSQDSIFKKEETERALISTPTRDLHSMELLYSLSRCLYSKIIYG